MLSKKQEKWIKEGRGQGELADYKPWIKNTTEENTTYHC